MVSCIPDKQYEVFQELDRRDLKPRTERYVEVKKLEGGSEVGTILERWLSDDNRSITAEQKELVLAAAGEASTSLKLKALYDLTEGWRSYDEPGKSPHEGVDAPVPSKLPYDVPSIIEYVFDRVESVHGALLVRHTFGYLSVAKEGLSEEEILDLLSLDDPVLDSVLLHHEPPVRRIPPLTFYLLKNQLGGYLIERGADGAPVLGWYHRQWWEAAERRYGLQGDKEHCRKLASSMADYFSNFELASDPTRRAEAEKRKVRAACSKQILQLHTPRRPPCTAWALLEGAAVPCAGVVASAVAFRRGRERRAVGECPQGCRAAARSLAGCSVARTRLPGAHAAMLCDGSSLLATTLF